MNNTPVLLVQGTHAWGRTDQSQEWWDCGGQFCRFLTSQGFSILGASQPYIWDTDLDGIGWLKRRAHKKHLNWEAAGVGLYNYLANKLVTYDYVPIKDRNIIAHSHAMQVVAYACAMGLKVNRIVTLASPVRADMQPVYERARPNIAEWRHVHSDGSDRVQWFGELFDGHLGIVRQQPLADVNVLVPNVAHSKLLNDPACFALWNDVGLLDFLRGTTYAAQPVL